MEYRPVHLVGPEPPEEFEGDGCSASPDILWGVPLHIACRLHDWHYDPESGVSRFMADFFFQRNLFRLCRAYGLGRIRSHFVSIPYMTAVRIFAPVRSWLLRLTGKR